MFLSFDMRLENNLEFFHTYVLVYTCSGDYLEFDYYVPIRYHTKIT